MGARYASRIAAWQQQASFCDEVEWGGAMVQQEARRVLELDGQLTALETNIESVMQSASMARLLASIPGYGLVCAAALAGESGTLDRFKRDASLGL